MADDRSPSAGEQARALKDDLSPAKLNAKLEDVIEERPKTAHLLDFRIVGRALLVAVVVAIVLALLVSPPIAAIALVVIFFGGWLIGAQVSYDRRRETRDVREDPSAKAEEDDSPPRQVEARTPDSDEYQADRGELEAEQEQEDGEPRERAADRE